jgi:hypothetical protein
MDRAEAEFFAGRVFVEEADVVEIAFRADLEVVVAGSG